MLSHQLIRVIADVVEIPVARLRGEDRGRELGRVRQLAMAVIRHETAASVAEIAKLFGRHHSSVIYALGKIEKSPELQTQAESLRLAVQERVQSGAIGPVPIVVERVQSGAIGPVPIMVEALCDYAATARVGDMIPAHACPAAGGCKADGEHR